MRGKREMNEELEEKILKEVGKFLNADKMLKEEMQKIGLDYYNFYVLYDYTNNVLEVAKIEVGKKDCKFIGDIQISDNVEETRNNIKGFLEKIKK
jgi:hypothetical protein